MMRIKKKKKLVSVLLIFILLLFAFFVSKYLYQIMLIQGDSMEPTYKNMSLVIVDKHSGEIKKGDVIAFTSDSVKGVLVKRVVGVPGDSLQIINGILYVNDKESNITASSEYISYAGVLENKMILSAGEYFVLGDNLSKSKDSRYVEIGITREENVIGRICFPVR